MEPKFYQMKRYTLIVVCCISILGNIVNAALIPGSKENELQHNMGIVIGAFGIAILFQLFGLIGAWREHFCLTFTYTVLQMLGTIFQVWNAILQPIAWVNVVISLLVCIVAICFLVDIRTIQNAQITNQTTTGPTAPYPVKIPY